MKVPELNTLPHHDTCLTTIVPVYSCNVQCKHVCCVHGLGQVNKAPHWHPYGMGVSKVCVCVSNATTVTWHARFHSRLRHSIFYLWENGWSEENLSMRPGCSRPRSMLCNHNALGGCASLLHIRDEYLTLSCIAIIKLHYADSTDGTANPNTCSSKDNFLAYQLPTMGMESAGRGNCT